MNRTKWIRFAAATLLLSAAAVYSSVDAKPQQNDCKPLSEEAERTQNKFPGTGSFEAWKTSVPEYQAGLRSMRNKRWDDAIGHFKASLALYEFQPKCWLEIGRAMEARDGDPHEAENAYRQALKLDSSNWRAWKRLGNVLLVQKKYSAAREAVSNAIALNPPQQARNELDKMIQAIEAGEKSGDPTP